jgi:DNA repair protein RecN (Recombination protein N)
MKEAGIKPDGEGRIELRREISPDGKNLCTAGARSLTVTQLRHLGTQLINIHGQHDGQLLLDETCHLDYLDRFARNEDLLSDYREFYDRVSDLEVGSKCCKWMKRRRSSNGYPTLPDRGVKRQSCSKGRRDPDERRKLLRNASKLGTV